MNFFFFHSYGVVFSEHDDTPLFKTNAPRNVNSTSVESFSVFYIIIWKGRVCPKMLGANCTNLQASPVPPGQYKLRFSALKNFGNATNPADFDIYRTPPFNLVY